MLSLSHTALTASAEQMDKRVLAGYYEMDPDKSAKAQKPQRSEGWKK